MPTVSKGPSGGFWFQLCQELFVAYHMLDVFQCDVNSKMFVVKSICANSCRLLSVMARDLALQGLERPARGQRGEEL